VQSIHYGLISLKKAVSGACLPEPDRMALTGVLAKMLSGVAWISDPRFLGRRELASDMNQQHRWLFPSEIIGRCGRGELRLGICDIATELRRGFVKRSS